MACTRLNILLEEAFCTAVNMACKSVWDILLGVLNTSNKSSCTSKLDLHFAFLATNFVTLYLSKFSCIYSVLSPSRVAETPQLSVSSQYC